MLSEGQETSLRLQDAAKRWIEDCEAYRTSGCYFFIMIIVTAAACKQVVSRLDFIKPFCTRVIWCRPAVSSESFICAISPEGGDFQSLYRQEAHSIHTCADLMEDKRLLCEQRLTQPLAFRCAFHIYRFYPGHAHHQKPHVCKVVCLLDAEISPLTGRLCIVSLLLRLQAYSVNKSGETLSLRVHPVTTTTLAQLQSLQFSCIALLLRSA